MRQRILITGGTGFFGKSILDYHRRIPIGELTILSRFASLFVDHYPELSAGVRFVDGDVRTFDVGDDKYDAIIHAATPARTDVEDDEMRSIIIDGTANALRQAKKCGASKFMLISSGGVYGDGLRGPVSETDTPFPCTAYGQSKLVAERMAVASGLHVLLPRCFAFVGRYLPRDAHFAIGNFIRDAIEGRDIVIKGDGSPVRSYMHADDLVKWLCTILEHGESGRVYNVGSDEAISIRDLATLVRDTLGSTSKVKVLGEVVPGAANYYIPDISRVKQELGLMPVALLREAIYLSVS